MEIECELEVEMLIEAYYKIEVLDWVYVATFYADGQRYDLEMRSYDEDGEDVPDWFRGFAQREYRRLCEEQYLTD